MSGYEFTACEAVADDHWFMAGERAAERVLNSGSKNTAEIEANIKGLYGKPKMSFVSGFRLYVAERKDLV